MSHCPLRPLYCLPLHDRSISFTEAGPVTLLLPLCTMRRQTTEATVYELLTQFVFVPQVMQESQIGKRDVSKKYDLLFGLSSVEMMTAFSEVIQCYLKLKCPEFYAFTHRVSCSLQQCNYMTQNLLVLRTDYEINAPEDEPQKP